MSYSPTWNEIKFSIYLIERKKEGISQYNLMDAVTVKVFFQKFDKEWGAFIDLEDDDELNDKDKVKAVVTHTPDLQSPKGIDSVATS